MTATAAFSGMRPLAAVLESARVMRARRDESLNEAYLYAVKFGREVVAYPIEKWTPKRVYFIQWLTRLDDKVYSGIYYADSAALLRDGEVHISGAGWPSEIGNTLYGSRATAERMAGRDIRQLRHAMADAHPDRGGSRDGFMAARRRYVQVKESAAMLPFGDPG